jgi:2,3-dihydroxybiphenyl 1,2-dioxygenase
MLKSLGYIGVQSQRLDDWQALATNLLGMQQVDGTAGSRAFRMDDRKQRLVINAAPSDYAGFLGWEVDNASDMNAIAARVEAYGMAVKYGNRRLAEERFVAELVEFADPGGNRREIFWGPYLDNEAFRPGREISGFRTGPCGMGHAVLNVDNIDTLAPFYTDVLGFKLTDFGLKPYKLYFYHLNGRHHSFAMVGSGRRSFHHFMVEVRMLDDVGQGYDLAQLDDKLIAYTLGRHTNDHMTSFYVHSPSGFFIEYGWGGRVIDPATWQPHETFDGPSLWGHDRTYMEPEQRAQLRDMRLRAAAKGVREELAVNCPWLDTVIAAE